jgi:ABC-type glycerol-3-phosphate transport system substrate-binding protein
MMVTRRYSCLAIVVACLVCLTACGEMNSGAAPTVESMVTLTTAPLISSSPVPSTPTPESTPAGPTTLSVWWPEPLAPDNNDDASLLLSTQVDDFEVTEPNIRVDIRLKLADGVGGILETMRAGNTVAPDALPDVTLMRREDLLEAVAIKLIQPMGNTALTSIRPDLYPTALELGLVNRQFYGVPYTLDIQHIAYRSVILGGNFARFADVLNDNQKFVFPAGVGNTSGDMLLLQYLSAGGTLTQINSGKLDSNALHTVFAFYQDAVTKGVIDTSVLNYASPTDYQAALASGQISAGIVTSSEYLELEKRGQTLATAPFPLAAGDPTTTVNGWMWVMVTKDKDRQAEALHFIEWMLDAGRQTAYAETAHMIPSRRSAMQQWDQEAYRQFANNLLLNARIPFVAGENDGLLEALQSALISVISGQRTADEAVQDVFKQLSG